MQILLVAKTIATNHTPTHVHGPLIFKSFIEDLTTIGYNIQNFAFH